MTGPGLEISSTATSSASAAESNVHKLYLREVESVIRHELNDIYPPLPSLVISATQLYTILAATKRLHLPWDSNILKKSSTLFLIIHANALPNKIYLMGICRQTTPAVVGK